MSLPGSWRSALDPERVMQADIVRWQGREPQQRTDHLTVEEPLEVRINDQPLAVIMRTPGHDDELALGFLYSEGVIQQASDVVSLKPVMDADGLPEANVVNVTLDRQEEHPSPFERRFAVSSSCGLCGKQSISNLLCTTTPLAPDDLRIPATMLYNLPTRLRAAQAVFTHTGGLHAAAIFSSVGDLQVVREDVGRHNAVDKLCGYGLLHGTLPYMQHILLVSGRTSFEIIQKALLARIPCIAAISAPSSLAVDLAARVGITLVGFLREQSMNVYTHPERIIA